jgi:hypothetical protein
MCFLNMKLISNANPLHWYDYYNSKTALSSSYFRFVHPINPRVHSLPASPRYL